LVPLLEGELRRIAHHYMRKERPGHTLQTTALVNEAYLKLVDQAQVDWKSRAQFLGVAAGLMRHILVDRARELCREKRGGGAAHLPLDEALIVSPAKSRALVLGVHPNTVIRDWGLAKTWLTRELGPQSPHAA
jgi:RNA polymerase sigma factor (TIGR02999 family)